MKVLWIKAPVLALSVLDYRARSARNRARTAKIDSFLLFLVQEIVVEQQNGATGPSRAAGPSWGLG